MQNFDVIIPARNEASTIAAVIRAARSARGVNRVIVVDDHSTDGTPAIARDAGAEVIVSAGRGDKAKALATGVEESREDVLVFFDSDILDARPEHFEQLAAPIFGGYALSCGIVDYGRLRNRVFLRLPPITGLRAMRREIFASIPEEKRRGFQIEIMINEVIARNGLPAAIQVLPGAGHRSKRAKEGFVRGTISHVRMTAELLHCFTFVPLWTYRAYLRNLTILQPGWDLEPNRSAVGNVFSGR